MKDEKIRWIGSKASLFRLGTFSVGFLLLTIGSFLVGFGSVYMFLGGFLLVTALQIMTWCLGIKLEILGNVPAHYDFALSELDLGRSRTTVAERELRNRAGEYYEATRERAAELYAEAAGRVTDVAKSAGETASRQTGTLAAAIDVGKKAYQEEKRRTELSGGIEAERAHKEKPN